MLENLKKERLNRNRCQKEVYKKLVLHLSMPNRRPDILLDGSDFSTAVQPEEIRMAACMQVVLDAGWSLTQDNFPDFLELSGVQQVKEMYWDHIN